MSTRKRHTQFVRIIKIFFSLWNKRVEKKKMLFAISSILQLQVFGDTKSHFSTSTKIKSTKRRKFFVEILFDRINEAKCKIHSNYEGIFFFFSSRTNVSKQKKNIVWSFLHRLVWWIFSDSEKWQPTRSPKTTKVQLSILCITINHKIINYYCFVKDP